MLCNWLQVQSPEIDGNPIQHESRLHQQGLRATSMSSREMQPSSVPSRYDLSTRVNCVVGDTLGRNYNCCEVCLQQIL